MSDDAPGVEVDIDIDIDIVLHRFAGQTVDQDNIAHYRGLLQRRLLINRCRKCGTWHHPPHPICPACWSFDVGPTEVSGRGAIFLLTFLARGSDVALRPVATVELDEQPGLRYTATLVNSDEPDAQVGVGDVQIGDRVQLTWVDGDGAAVPAFHRVGEALSDGESLEP